MLIPALRLARDEERGGKNFLRLVGRAYADPAPLIRHFLSAQYAEMIGRYKEAFHRALPQLRSRSSRGGCISSWARSHTRSREPTC